MNFRSVSKGKTFPFVNGYFFFYFAMVEEIPSVTEGMLSIL